MTQKYQDRNRRGLFRVLLCTILVFAGLVFSGFGKNTPEEASGTGVYFDTVVDIRIFGPDADDLLQGCFDLCQKAEKTLSAHLESSELYLLNHRSEQSVEVSDELAACIARGIEYGDLSEGKFDITILPLKELWNFESEDPEVPGEKEIQEALRKVDYHRVHVDGSTVTFDDPDTQIDLGGIAKGYISETLKNWLKEQGCTSALINLGGNVSVLGSKPDGSDWNVGIQEPFADRGTILEVVKVNTGCVISSGTYERFFEQDGKSWHHILDPSTGRPAVTDLQQASVVGEDDVLCDAFSTICILTGREEAERLAEENKLDVRILFVGEDHEGVWYP